MASAAGATRLLSALETGTPARPVQGEAQTCEYQTAWGLLVWGSSPVWRTPAASTSDVLSAVQSREACPRRGEARPCEQQTCLGPCLLVRGSSPVWHTTAIVWWSRLCRVCSASMSQSWYHAHSASRTEYDTNRQRAQLSAHLTGRRRARNQRICRAAGKFERRSVTVGRSWPKVSGRGAAMCPCRRRRSHRRRRTWSGRSSRAWQARSSWRPPPSCTQRLGTAVAAVAAGVSRVPSDAGSRLAKLACRGDYYCKARHL